jgi:citrate lyase subunit beta/citryl-CoA lyase
MTIHSIKSLHFIPAHKTNFFDYIIKEAKTKPDALVFDLEDSVKPEAKDMARENLVKIFENHREVLQNYFVIIRGNNEASEYYSRDIKVLKTLKPNAILLAKVEDKKEIKHARKVFKDIPIIVAIETIKGVENREQIIGCLQKDDAVVVGYEDLSAELMIERPKELSSVNPLTSLLFEVFNTARKHKIKIFDAVCRYYKEEDLKILENECEYTSTLRFSGKFSIHPNQIGLINSYFDKKRITDFAIDVVGRFNDVKDGTAVIVKDNQMMDTPSLNLYKRYGKDD